MPRLCNLMRRCFACRCCCCKDSDSSHSSGDSESALSEDEDDFWEHYEQREFDSFAFPPGVLCPTMICCSVPKGPEEISGFPPRSSSEQKHCWDTADGVGIKVRGPQYLQDRKKSNSKSPMLTLDAVELIRGRDLESYSTGPKCRFKSNGFSFIMNFRLPDVQLVIIWSLAEGVDWLDTPQGLHFRRFVYEMSAEERSKRLKLIARVLEGSFMLKQAVGSKPAIIGNQCRIQYFQQQDCLEASMDMADSSIGRRLRGILDDGSSVLELYILLEGLHQHELPERILGGLTLCRVDVSSMAR
ncbi:unnamed protein product [Durusdinium trenchii]|uniref:Protein ENHANCED DISEASE RESISTANCE 2 C-terminal domain-containing protein n=1 Tax=Durusdinium trenchii TaxID=1381693 RepID=A0ABP0T2A0_9DINO